MHGIQANEDNVVLKSALHGTLDKLQATQKELRATRSELQVTMEQANLLLEERETLCFIDHVAMGIEGADNHGREDECAGSGRVANGSRGSNEAAIGEGESSAPSDQVDALASPMRNLESSAFANKAELVGPSNVDALIIPSPTVSPGGTEAPHTPPAYEDLLCPTAV